MDAANKMALCYSLIGMYARTIVENIVIVDGKLDEIETRTRYYKQKIQHKLLYAEF